MIDLYFAPTANGQRASIALEECGLPYRLHRVDLAKGETRTAEYLKLNPAGQMPVIVDDESPGGKPITVAQSGAIILYLCEKAGKFLPKDLARRTLAQQWFMQGGTDVAATSGAIFQVEVAAAEKHPSNVEHFKKRLLNFFSVCDRHLEGREHFADEMSIADLMLYPNFAARKPLIDAAGGYANLQRWGAAMAARPGVAKGMKPG